MIKMYKIEEFDKEKSRVLKFILYKKRTKYEIEKKFEKVIEKNMLDDIIAYLEEAGYINDEEYIERAVNEFIALKNLSIKEIKYKLISKGVPNNEIEDYFYNNKDNLEEYEINSAYKILLKKFSDNEQTAQEYLLKKGYKKENINEAIRKIKE